MIGDWNGDGDGVLLSDILDNDDGVSRDMSDEGDAAPGVDTLEGDCTTVLGFEFMKTPDLSAKWGPMVGDEENWALSGVPSILSGSSAESSSSSLSSQLSRPFSSSSSASTSRLFLRTSATVTAPEYCGLSRVARLRANIPPGKLSAEEAWLVSKLSTKKAARSVAGRMLGGEAGRSSTPVRRRAESDEINCTTGECDRRGG